MTLHSHKFLGIIEQQLSASPTQVVRAAALVASVERDTEAIRFLAQVITAMQRSQLNYNGDVATLACLR
jgi:hypothetical protein